MRARLYHRVSPGAGPAAVDFGLEQLRQEARARGWEIAGEYSDVAGRGRDPWPGRARLKAEAQRGDVLLVGTVARLARSMPDLVDVLSWILDHGLHLLTTVDTVNAYLVDTTQLGSRVALHDAVRLIRTVRHDQLAEAQLRRQLAPHGPQPGHPALAVNPLEVVDLYHAGRSQREISKELTRRGAPASRTKVQQVLAHLQAHGRLDETRRQKAIQARGGLPKGGRPRKRS